MHTFSFLFFFNDTATTEIYTLSLHELFRSPCPSRPRGTARGSRRPRLPRTPRCADRAPSRPSRSEEHTSELQSHSDLVCRLLLEKKKKKTKIKHHITKQYDYRSNATTFHTN